MFDELSHYKENGHFFFTNSAPLSEVCNAPKGMYGVFYVIMLKQGRVKLVCIDSAGETQQNGITQVVGDGLYETIVNRNFKGESRSNSWAKIIQEDNIDALDVYWFVTFNENYSDIPRSVEAAIKYSFLDRHGKLPEWNL